MQRVWPYEQSLDHYLKEQDHLRVRPEPACPLCGTVQGLRAHGYYWRWILGQATDQPCQLPVRRFRCRRCRKTVSYLPGFAQPYRLLSNGLIHTFFAGSGSWESAGRWGDHLKRGWQQFLTWLPALFQTIGCALGRPPDGEPPVQAWRRLVEKGGGDLSATTRKLVTTWQVTLFHRYQCHQHAR